MTPRNYSALSFVPRGAACQAKAARSLDLDAVGLGEGVLRVGQRRVCEAAVTPGGAPAVAHDERGRRVGDERDGVPAVLRLRVVDVQLALVLGRAVPGRVDVEPGEDRALRREP